MNNLISPDPKKLNLPGSEVRAIRSGTPTKLTDVGVKIGGARKDIWAGRALTLEDTAGMTGAEKAELVTKDAVWPRPDYLALVDAGAEPRAIRRLKTIYDSLPCKPKQLSDAGIDTFITYTKLIQSVVEGVQTYEEAKDLHIRLNAIRGVQPPRLRNELCIRDQKSNTEERDIAAGWPHAKKAPVVRTTKGQLPTRPHLDRITRVGPDYRGGRDIVSQDFIDVFGFRAVEFGNWVADDERQRVVDHAFDALHDFSRVLGCSPKDLSLGGRLAVAFGARGVGGFAAHYEPARTVINLTRVSGAGALAHEWGHAFDHYLGEIGSKLNYTDKPCYLSGGMRYAKPTVEGLPGLTTGLNAAAYELMSRIYTSPRDLAEQIEQTEQHIANLRAEAVTAKGKRAQRLWKVIPFNEQLIAEWRTGERPLPTKECVFFANAKTLGDYWKRPTELFARAFESFVFDKLHADGCQSDYLVHGVEEDRYAGPAYRGNPYPTGSERRKINETIAGLVAQYTQPCPVN